MKVLVVLCLLALGCACAKETYTTENDDFDIDTLVRNEEQLQGFVDCFRDMKECDPVAAGFKKDIREAVQTACLKCTVAQKHIFKKFLDALKEKLPKEYEGFTNTYDPEGKYFGPLEEAVASS